MLIQTEWSTNDASLIKMLVEENRNSLFFDKTLPTLQHFHWGVQKLRIHSPSIIAPKK